MPTQPAQTAAPAVSAASPALLRRTRRELRRRTRRTRWAARWQTVRGPGGLRILAAAAGGVSLQFAFAPSTAWWAAILGLALLGLAVHGRAVRPSLGLGLVFGLTFYLPLLWWTTVYVGGVAVALGIAEALLTAPAVAVIAACSRRLPVWPVWAAGAWLAGEALRARFPFGGFPWGGVAFSQADGPLLPTASLLGAPGLAFLTALAGFSLAAATLSAWRRQWQPMAVGLVAVLLVFGFGLIGRTTEVAAAGHPRTTIAVIQGNVPEPGLEFNARRRAVLDLHAKQTHQLAADVRAGKAARPDLVIWPENSSDIDPYTNTDAAAVIGAAAADIGVPVLVGAVVGAGTGTKGDVNTGEYNMGIVWDPQTGPGATYTKRHPVPFAEYMPWRPFFRFFTAWVDRAGNFLPGDAPGNLTIAGVNVGDVICFEVVYDNLVGDVIDGGAQVLVVQTNNATFGYTNETYQQQAMSRVRAVEYGRQVLIAATSGVSAVIGPDGTVQGSVPLFTPGYLDVSVPLIQARTPGSYVGAPLEWTVTVCTLLLLVAATLRSRRTARRTDVRTPEDAAS